MLLRRLVLRVFSLLFVATLISFPLLQVSNVHGASGSDLQPAPTIPPSLTLLGAGASWAAQNGNSTLFIDWEDNYLAHGNTDGVNWGPWPSQTDMENQTDSVTYALDQYGLNVTLAGDIPTDLTGYNLVVIAAYWACTPANLAEISSFIAGGGGVVLLAGVPEYFRTYCKNWWTYNCTTDPLSVGMDEIFGCDGNYFNTGGYANITVDNPFNTALMAGDTVFESTGDSCASVLNPYNGSQVLAQWNPGLYYISVGDTNVSLGTVAFAYTFQYGLGRVYYQADFTPMDTPVDPPARIPADVNNQGVVNMDDVVTVLYAFGSTPGMPNWNPNCDLEGNGRIDMGDLVIVLRSFGQHDP